MLCLHINGDMNASFASQLKTLFVTARVSGLRLVLMSLLRFLSEHQSNLVTCYSAIRFGLKTKYDLLTEVAHCYCMKQLSLQQIIPLK